MDEVISHRDVTTVMGMLASIETEVKLIRQLLEEEEDGEETPDDDG